MEAILRHRLIRSHFLFLCTTLAENIPDEGDNGRNFALNHFPYDGRMLLRTSYKMTGAKNE